MNEIPPIPESENSNWNSSELEDPQLDELEAELEIKATSEPIEDLDDVWSSENTDNDNKDLDAIEVTVEPSAEELAANNPPDISADIPESNKKVEELSSPYPEVASEQETEIIGEEIAEALENEPEAKSAKESELFVDSWLDEPQVDSAPTIPTEETPVAIADKTELDSLESKKATLQQEIAELQAQKETMLLEQSRAVQENMAQMIEEGTKELKERRTNLQIEIEKLERRRDRINKEMRSNFAGSSQELAVKVQGFKEYLVGSLQDLSRAADKLELVKTEAPPRRNLGNREPQDRVRDDWETGRSRNRRDRDSRERGDSRDPRSRRDRDRSDSRDPRSRRDRGERNSVPSAPQGQFSEPTFADQGRRIRQLIDKYRNNPDYYGAPWQLRRTFEPIHAKRVQDWFFVQGGRGTIDSMGSRLQNILVASATISILYSLHGDRCRFLVLTDTPENLGEWRKGLQDCLGISRSNFGSNRGVTLFDAPEIVVQRAERLLEEKLLPVIIIDETEELLNLSVLKFPLWLAFASSNKQASSNYLY